MAISYRSSSTYTTGATTSSHTVTKPAGVVEGDLMVAVLSTKHDVTTAPSGWTNRHSSTGGGIRFNVYTKQAGASEPADYTWSTSDLSDTTICIAAYDGVDDTTPFAQAGTYQFIENTTPTSLGVTTGTDNNWILHTHVSNATVTATPPSGMTERVDFTGNARTVYISDEAIPTAGATGNRVATASAICKWHSVMLELNTSPEIAGAASVSGTASQTSTAAQTLGGDASVNGSATKSASSALTVAAASTISGAASFSGTGAKEKPAASTISGTASVTGNNDLTAETVASVSGSASATSTAEVINEATSSISGSASTTPIGQVNNESQSFPSASASTSADAQVDNAATASPSGAATTMASASTETIALVRSSSTYTQTAGTSVVIPKPAGTAADDVLIGIITNNDTTVGITPPAGWTLINEQDNGTDVAQCIFWKLATASEPANYTFTLSGNDKAAAVGIAIEVADRTTPIHVAGYQNNASSTSLTAPTVTSTQNVALLLSVFSHDNGNQTMTPPGGMFVVNEADSGGSGVVTYVTREDINSGATGTRVATADVAAANIGSNLVIETFIPVTHEGASSVTGTASSSPSAQNTQNRSATVSATATNSGAAEVINESASTISGSASATLNGDVICGASCGPTSGASTSASAAVTYSTAANLASYATATPSAATTLGADSTVSGSASTVFDALPVVNAGSSITASASTSGEPNFTWGSASSISATASVTDAAAVESNSDATISGTASTSAAPDVERQGEATAAVTAAATGTGAATFVLEADASIAGAGVATAFAGDCLVSVSQKSSKSAKATLTIPMPANVSEGNLLIATINTTLPVITQTPPSGWTVVGASFIDNAGNNRDMTKRTFWKLATASEPSGYTWNFDNPTKASGGIVNIDAGDVTYDVFSKDEYATDGTGITSSGVTTTYPSELVLAFFASATGKDTITGPAGWARLWSNNTLGDSGTTGIAVAKFFDTPGPTGNIVATNIYSRPRIAHAVGVRCHSRVTGQGSSTGSASTSVTGQVQNPLAATVSAAASVTPTASVDNAAAASISGTASTVFDALPVVNAVGSLTGAATSSADPDVTWGVSGSASASASVAETAEVVNEAASTVTSVATTSSDAEVINEAAASVTGVASTSFDALPVVNALSSISATASTTAGSDVTWVGASSISSASASSADAEVINEALATVSGIASASGDNSSTKESAATISAAATVVSNASPVVNSVANVSATASSSGVNKHTYGAAANPSGIATTSSDSQVINEASSSTLATAAISASDVTTIDASATVSGSATTAASATPEVQSSATVSASATTTAGPNVTYGPTETLTAIGVTAAASSVINEGTANPSPAASVTATGNAVYAAAASTEAVGEANAFSDSCLTGISTAVTTNSNTVITVNVPLGTTDGDLMVASITAAIGNTTTITPPAGWTLLHSTQSSSGTDDISKATYWRIASSEPANYTWTFSTSSKADAAIMSFHIRDAGAPFDFTAANLYTPQTTTLSSPVVTTSVPNVSVLYLISVSDGRGSWASNSGLPEIYDVASGGGSGTNSALYSEFLEDAGTDDSESFTSLQAGRRIIHTLAVKCVGQITAQGDLSGTANTTGLGSYNLEGTATVSAVASTNANPGTNAVSNISASAILSGDPVGTYAAISNPIGVASSNAVAVCNGEAAASVLATASSALNASPLAESSATISASATANSNALVINEASTDPFAVAQSTAQASAVYSAAASVDAVGESFSFGGDDCLVGVRFAEKKNASTTLTIPKPSSTVQGHMMVASIDASLDADQTITPPTGWTSIRKDATTDGGSTTKLTKETFYKVAGPSEPSDYTFTHASPTKSEGAIVTVNARTSSPDTFSGVLHDYDIGSSIIVPGITTTVNGVALLGFFSSASGKATITPPAGSTKIFEASSGGTAGTTGIGSFEDIHTAGATGSRTAVSSETGVRAGHLIGVPCKRRVIGRGDVTGVANTSGLGGFLLSSNGNLFATASTTANAEVNNESTTSITATATVVTASPTTSLSGESSLIATATTTADALVDNDSGSSILGTASTSADPDMQWAGAGNILATATTSANALTDNESQGNLLGTASITGGSTLGLGGDADANGDANTAVDPAVVWAAGSNLNGVSTTTPGANVVFSGQAALTGTATTSPDNNGAGTGPTVQYSATSAISGVASTLANSASSVDSSASILGTAGCETLEATTGTGSDGAVVTNNAAASVSAVATVSSIAQVNNETLATISASASTSADSSVQFAAETNTQASSSVATLEATTGNGQDGAVVDNQASSSALGSSSVAASSFAVVSSSAGVNASATITPDASTTIGSGGSVGGSAGLGAPASVNWGGAGQLQATSATSVGAGASGAVVFNNADANLSANASITALPEVDGLAQASITATASVLANALVDSSSQAAISASAEITSAQPGVVITISRRQIVIAKAVGISVASKETGAGSGASQAGIVDNTTVQANVVNNGLQ